MPRAATIKLFISLVCCFGAGGAIPTVNAASMGMARDCADKIATQADMKSFDVVVASGMKWGQKSSVIETDDGVVLMLKDKWLPVASASSLYQEMASALDGVVGTKRQIASYTKSCLSPLEYARNNRSDTTGSRLGVEPPAAAASSVEVIRDNYSTEGT